MVVLGPEAAPAAGERAQVDGVALDLGGGHEGGDLLQPPSTVSVPCTRPRRELRSPRTSPCMVAGTVTSSSEIGSSSTGPALAMASRKASDPAILKLISDESTGWYLPSKHVTCTSTTG